MTIESNAEAVRFQDVTKAFGAVVAVSDINFTIEVGTLVTLLGPSGCGKTTTLRLIAGLEMATSGAIFIGGEDVTRLSATDRDVSMVFQSYALFPHMNVLDNVAYGLKVSGMAKPEAYAQGEEVLKLVGLAGYGPRLPSELSGGQQQRVAVARALVLEPKVLLFDEPLSNLDAKLRRHMREEIRDLQRNLGLTSVYVTHDQEEALAVSDRIIVMRNAAIAQEGNPRELYEEPADAFVADFIGDSNLVRGEIVSVDADKARVRIGGIEKSLISHGLKPGSADVAIRPESIHLEAGAADGGIEGNVLKATYLGNHMEYTVETAIGELFVIDHEIGAMLSRGAAVTVVLDDRGVNLVLPGNSPAADDV